MVHSHASLATQTLFKLTLFELPARDAGVMVGELAESLRQRPGLGVGNVRVLRLDWLRNAAEKAPSGLGTGECMAARSGQWGLELLKLPEVVHDACGGCLRWWWKGIPQAAEQTYCIWFGPHP